MTFSELPFRTKANYIFFWINLFVAFMLAFNGSWMSIFHLIISFFCWAAYGVLPALPMGRTVERLLQNLGQRASVRQACEPVRSRQCRGQCQVSHAYPLASSSNARDLSPDSMILPLDSTCTKSGTM